MYFSMSAWSRRACNCRNSKSCAGVRGAAAPGGAGGGGGGRPAGEALRVARCAQRPRQPLFILLVKESNFALNLVHGRSQLLPLLLQLSRLALAGGRAGHGTLS